ncbi:MAG: hypothetical protein ACLQCU_11895 [Acidimicrobiales bacterium]|jgi:hypothetical protein
MLTQEEYMDLLKLQHQGFTIAGTGTAGQATTWGNTPKHDSKATRPAERQDRAGGQREALKEATKLRWAVTDGALS